MQKLNLPGKTIKIIDSLIKELRDIYAKELVSIILYGSAASGEFVQQASDVNLLVVLDNAELPNLTRVSRLISKGKYKFIKAIFISQDYMHSCLDVFPIEFLDMKENYALLAGKDILEGLNVDLKNLRFQCEYELKSKLLNIKNLYLRNNGREDLEVLLFKSFTSILHLMRNLLRLKNVSPPYLKQDVLNVFSHEFGISVFNFNIILAAKNKNTRLSYAELDDMLLGLVLDLEKIIRITNNL
ncbi:MAG TPA: nucleotidyltransferase domain-containing protein [Candidatus Margulisiibacteriota bacterium]|nr:nucleotidyltransferase domain-containing protein [Candidatus Margulisiibacteriota bacterium]